MPFGKGGRREGGKGGCQGGYTHARHTKHESAFLLTNSGYLNLAIQIQCGRSTFYFIISLNQIERLAENSEYLHVTPSRK